jgi:hypothetical protein
MRLKLPQTFFLSIKLNLNALSRQISKLVFFNSPFLMHSDSYLGVVQLSHYVQSTNEHYCVSMSPETRDKKESDTRAPYAHCFLPYTSVHRPSGEAMLTAVGANA